MYDYQASTPILQDALISMKAAADNIQENARHKGFIGDPNDAKAVLSFLAHYEMDVVDYALLYANSAVIETNDQLVQRWGSAEDKAQATAFRAFDYNA